MPPDATNHGRCVTIPWEGVPFGMGDVIPFPPASPDKPWIVCIGSDGEFTRRSAPDPVAVGDLVFHDLDCWIQWKNSGNPGMT